MASLTLTNLGGAVTTTLAESRLSDLLHRFAHLPLTWQRRARDRRILRELADWQLKDVDLTRRQLEKSATAPFWKNQSA